MFSAVQFKPYACFVSIYHRAVYFYYFISYELFARHPIYCLIFKMSENDHSDPMDSMFADIQHRYEQKNNLSEHQDFLRYLVF